MMNRKQFATILAFVPAADRLAIFREHRPLDGTLDRSFRGCGNAAMRRMGLDTERHSCGCDVAVVYGGDCDHIMWREGHDEWHRAKRGVKTRGH